MKYMTGVTSGAGTAIPFGAPEFTIGFNKGSCCSIFSLLCSVLPFFSLRVSVILKYTVSISMLFLILLSE